MKKLICFIVVLSIAAVAVFGCSSTEQPSAEVSTQAASSQAAATAVAESGPVTGDSASTEEPIKIGVLVPLTGAFASLGIDGMEGTKMAFEELGYEINGRPVELYFEDTAADPTLCVQKVSRLVERDGVQIILGPLSGGEATALKDYADNIKDVTVIVAGAASEDVTMRGVKDNVYRTSYTGAQVAFDFGTYAYEKLGYKKIVTLGEDYDFPFSQIGGFIETYVMAGGEVPQRLWVSVGTTDYSSVIAQIPQDIDAMFITLGGTDSINFIKQLDEFGLADKIDILAGSVTVDTTVLSSEAGSLFEGVLSCSHYSQVLPYPEFDSFDKSFVERYARPSSLFAADYYIGAQVCISALNAVGGNIEDQEAYRKALEAVEMDTPRGPFKFDEYHNVIENVYINKVENIDGTLRNNVIETFKDVTQFGPFDPEWYQSQPSYDRENPTVETIQGAKLK